MLMLKVCICAVKQAAISIEPNYRVVSLQWKCELRPLVPPGGWLQDWEQPFVMQLFIHQVNNLIRIFPQMTSARFRLIHLNLCRRRGPGARLAGPPPYPCQVCRMLITPHE